MRLRDLAEREMQIRMQSGVEETEAHQAIAEDKQLVQAFKSGDEGAYDAIYQRHGHRVDRVCKRMLGNPHDAQEASQETFLRVYQALPRFNGRYQLGAWVTTIATNVCLDQLRARSRRPVVPSTLEELDAEMVEQETAASPETFVLKSAEGRRVRRVLDHLPPMHRAAIILRDFEGLSYEETAVALGISDVQVKALIHRARKGFRRSWIPESVAALLPSRILERFRRIGGQDGSNQSEVVGRHAGQLTEVASGAAHAAASCAPALNNCGVALGEKLAGAATAAAVAIGLSGAGVHIADATNRTATVRIESEAPRPVSTERVAFRPTSTVKPKTIENKKAEAPRVGERPASTDEAPPPQAGPSPQPSPSSEPEKPEPSPSPSQPPAAGGGDGKAQPAPAQQPLKTYIGMADAPAPATTPTGLAESVSCEQRTVTQGASSPFHTGEGPLTARLDLSVASTARFDLTFVHEDRDYRYNGGAGSVASSQDGDRVTLRFSGSYSLIGDRPPESANLPDYGRFEATLVLDCAASRVVTESIVLSR